MRPLFITTKYRRTEKSTSLKTAKENNMDKRIDNSDNEWLGLFETKDGYIYSKELKGSGNIVSVLGYRESNDKIEFVGRFEDSPVFHEDKLSLTALTGMIEENESPSKAAVREFYEEAGIKIDEKDLIDLGTLKPSSSACLCYIYAIDIKDAEPKNSDGDGTDREKKARCEMVTTKDISASSSAVLCATLLKLINYLS